MCRLLERFFFVVKTLRFFVASSAYQIFLMLGLTHFTPTLLLLWSMSDKTGSLSPVKIWTTALCVLMNSTRSEFVAQ
jgi:hypothetical protein